MERSSSFLFIWDGACGFCRFWVLHWRARVGRRVEFAPYQEVKDRFPGISEEDFRRSAKLVEADGTVLEAAAAVCRLVSLAGGWRRAWWWLYRRIPLFRWTAEVAYRLVAANRDLGGRVTTLLWGRDPRPSTFRITRRVVTTGVAGCYLVAFLSLAVQVGGLVGPEGILPVDRYLAVVRQTAGGGLQAWWSAPTLAWLAPSNGGLLVLCLAGAVASLLLALDVAPLASALAAWLLYLSLDVAGQAFLAFQWDILLLEAGFLLLFLAPGGWRPGGHRRAGPWFPAVWLLWWLLFRLILESGLVKLAAGDPVWRDLTALAYHYETQPIPNPVAWYAYELPLWVQQVSTLGTLVVELAVPFLFLLPRRPRTLGGLVVIAHQVLIFLTGNFGFFNLLTITLALSLFDDGFWRRLLRRVRGRGQTAARGSRKGFERSAPGGRPPLLEPVRRAATLGFLVVAVGLGCGQVARSAGARSLPDALMTTWRALSPFRLLNGYGLFADMTTTRPELILEGRTASGPWQEIDFRWKPDRLDERPPQVAPYMPRLDWQMWFAALRAEQAPPGAPQRVGYDRWLLGLAERLLAGSPRVWGLMAAGGPFRGADGMLRPPDALRVVLYEYRFATPQERAATGDWWERRRVGVYLPPVRRTPGGGLELASNEGG